MTWWWSWTTTWQVSWKMVGPLVKMSETPLRARSASPALGEHVGEILDSLGYSPEQVRQLRDMGVTR